MNKTQKHDISAGRLSRTSVLLLAFAATLCAFAAGAAPRTLWVDKSLGDDGYAGIDIGETNHPYASIQAAVNAASNGDTVKVLPGVYENGGYVADKVSNRVYIAKKIHLVSTHGAAVTTILGKHDTGDTANNGTNLAGDGVRCVRIVNTTKNKADGYGAVIEGFTLADGYAASGGGHGGALRANNTLGGPGAYIVDCVITNCTGTKVSSGSNGVICGGTIVRCAVIDSVAWSTLVNARAWNCVFSGNSGIRGVLASSKAVNCSFSGNDSFGYISFNDCQIINSVHSGWLKHHSGSTVLTGSACNVTGALVDPSSGDWRLLEGSSAIGLADAAALTNIVDFTDAEYPIAFTDFAGNSLPSNGVINAGAVQTVRPASTWWVDRAGGDDAYAGDGLGSQDHPYASIQAAVDRAMDGDTVKVLPGVYDNGGVADDTAGLQNRVLVTKRIHLVSTGGAAVTTIQGGHDSGDTANNGTGRVGDGVRCIKVVNSHTSGSTTFAMIFGHGCVIEGFTLQDGYASDAHGHGGAVLATAATTGSNTPGVYLVDCVLANCTGTLKTSGSNGVACGCTLARCAVVDSSAWSIIVNGWAWNSVFRGNTALQGVFARSIAVNCSLANNSCSMVFFGNTSTDGEVYSLVSEGSPSKASNQQIVFTNSVVGASAAFVDPANGDWRLRPGAAAIGIADAAHLTNGVDFSAAAFPIAFTDLYGNAMPSSGTINAGAVQETASTVYIATPAYGGVAIDGYTLGAANFVPRGATTLTIVHDASSERRLLTAVSTNGVAMPLAYGFDTLSIALPTAGGSHLDIDWAYGTDWYVDATAGIGSDLNDGFTPETPLATLAAVCTNGAVLAGDVLHVAAPSGTTDAGRHVAGVVKNNVVERFADHVGDISVAIGPGMGAQGVRFAYDWYVNEKTGSDSNDGFAPTTPFATLAAACTNAAVAYGDAIHVAEGIYSEGVVPSPNGRNVGSRALVKEGVLLVADGKRENTVIEGAEATGANIEETTFNSGSNAVRGVYMERNSVLRGFTIRGGRTRPYGVKDAATNDDFIGGGVTGENYNNNATRLVEDCTFTNNVAAWGGAAYGVNLVRCRITHYGVTRLGCATAYSLHENCYIDHSLGGSQDIWNGGKLLSTTVGEHPTTKGDSVVVSTTIPVATNCVFLGKVPKNNPVFTNSVNCIFGTWTEKSLRPEDLAQGSTSVFVANRTEAGLDDDGRPASKDSLVVDFCDHRPDLASSLDLDDNPRVQNGKIDCGCYEYDWRGDYAADIGAKNLSVASASPDVVEASGKVRLSDGCELVAAWKLRTASKRTFPVVISGDGTLDAYVNGSLVASLTSADGGFSWEGAAGTDEIRLAFSGDGYAELGKPGNVIGMTILLR